MVDTVFAFRRSFDMLKLSSVLTQPLQIFCFIIPGDGHQFVRYRQHTPGPRYDEVLEGQTHHTEKAGK